MSAGLNNSSKNGTTCSSHDSHIFEETTVSQLAASILSSLSTIIESKLPVAELDINPATSPQLENIQVETHRIPQETFNTLIDLLQIAEYHYSNLKGFRSKALRNEPIAAGAFKEQELSLRIGGVNIIHAHHKVISQHVGFVEKSWDEFDSRIREVFDQSEHIQRQQGRLDAVKDNIIPPLSAVHPALGPVENAGKVAMGLLAHELSCNLNQQLIELGISDKTLRESVLVAIDTKRKLEEYLRTDLAAREGWGFACEAIYSTEKLKERLIDEVTITSQRIDYVDKNLLQFISPIKQYLVQKNQYYGHGITVIREIEAFCDVVPKIIQDIKLILSAKEIIKSSHKARFGKTVYVLGLVTFEYLESMGDTFGQSPIDPAKVAQFLLLQTHKFSDNTGVLIHTLREILDNQISSSKSKRAEEKRKAGDRCYNSLSWRARTLVKSGEVRMILKRVENAIQAIYKMSVAAGTGKIVKPIGRNENEVERAHVEFDASNESLRRLHQVLGEDVEAGLKLLKELPIEEELPKSHIRQVWERLRFHRQKC